jgi:serine/threonine protein kinase
MGAGAQAHTYLAKDEQAESGRVVVVKQLALGRKGDHTWKKFDLFEREVRTLEGLRHPGIPRFLASFESEPGTFNLVMERAPGATLRAYAAKVRFTDAELVDILRRVLDILTYLHGLNPPVVHRDIKPANLVRDKNGHVSLVDFGGVRDVLRPDGGSTMVGTFGYMAPEQLHGQSQPATDLYALGATIVALAGGVEPEAVPRKGLRMDLGRHLAKLNPRLRAILTAMTEPDPDDRPQSAAAVLEMLDQMSAPSPRALEQRSPPSTRSLAQREGRADVAQHAVDEVRAFTGELPWPLRVLMRLILFVVGAGGYLSLLITRVALLPIVFGLISAFTRDASHAKIDRAHAGIRGALEEGSDGFRALALSRRSRKPRKQLSEPKE